MEGQDARAGDQWTLPEVWLSPCVGDGSREERRQSSSRSTLPGQRWRRWRATFLRLPDNLRTLALG